MTGVAINVFAKVRCSSYTLKQQLIHSGNLFLGTKLEKKSKILNVACLMETSFENLCSQHMTYTVHDMYILMLLHEKQ